MNDVQILTMIKALFEEEGGDLFDVRQAILGHQQQGGDPLPFDRILATCFANYCIDYLIQQLESGSTQSAFIGLEGKKVKFHNLEDFPRLIDPEYQRPKVQWWMALRPIARLLAKPGPS